MMKLRFKIERSAFGGLADAAYISDGEDVTAELKEAVWQALRLDVQVTISGVTMFAAAWEDPDHWAEDWAERLGIDYDDVAEAVAGLLAAATEGDTG